MLVLAILHHLATAQQCGGSACIVTAPCGVPDNSSAWLLVNKTIDGQQATNIALVR